MQAGVTRRQALRAGGAALAGLTAIGAASADHSDRQPPHVTISFDETYLDRYKPLLVRSKNTRDAWQGLYGWVASSPEHDTNVCVYWTSYSHQTGVSSYDSHRGDHEPVAVEVDAVTGDVERIRASIWHWQKGESTPDAVPMDGTNPRLKVVDPWHHYTAAQPSAPDENLPVRDLTAHWDNWLTNGLEEDVVVGAAYNPWVMSSKSDWWAPGAFGLPSSEALHSQATLFLQTLAAPDTVGSLDA